MNTTYKERVLPEPLFESYTPKERHLAMKVLNDPFVRKLVAEWKKRSVTIPPPEMDDVRKMYEGYCQALFPLTNVDVDDFFRYCLSAYKHRPALNITSDNSRWWHRTPQGQLFEQRPILINNNTQTMDWYDQDDGEENDVIDTYDLIFRK